MSPEEREDLEQQAGEYALGTLAGDERARFEAAMTREPWLRSAVDEWNRRLGPLTEAITPVEPPRALWRRVETAIGPAAPKPATAPLWERVAFWRWSAVGALAAAAALLLYVIAAPPTLRVDYVAVLNDAQARPAVVVAADLTARAIEIRQIAEAPAGKAHELWLVPGPGQSPRSLGVVAGAHARERLPTDLAAAFPRAILAVSLEPIGGSPTGQPTGPVLYSGPVLALAQ